MTNDVSLFDHMSHAAASRASMWGICGQIAARPTAEFVDQLRSGALVQRIENALVWLGDTFDVEPLVGPLNAFRNRSDRFPAEQDLAELIREWQRTDSPGIVELFRREEQLAKAEAEAWRDEETRRAKQGRAAQIEGFVPQLPSVLDWCHRSHDPSQLLIWKALIRIVVSHAGVEGARDLLSDFDDPARRLSLEFE